MTRLIVRLFLGVQVAVLLSVLFSAALVVRDVTVRRREVLRDVMRGNVAYVEHVLGTSQGAARHAKLREAARQLGVAVALVDAPVAVRRKLQQDGDAVSERLDGPIYYRTITRTGEVLALGPMPRLVRYEPTLFVTFVLGLLVIVNVVALVLGLPLARDLRTVHRAVERFGQGDLSRRAEVRDKGAIFDLAQGFNRMADRVARMVAGQRHLFQAVSHELRTPHARMRFALDLLEQAELPAERARHVRSIEEDLSEVDQLVDELLTYLRFDTDAPPLERETFDAHAVVCALAERAQAGGPAIEVRGARTDLRASAKYFRRVVENLLANAARHARSQVTVSVESSEAAVCVVVDDDGPGVPSAERERIFEPFATLEPARTPKLGSAGLGLAIVQRIVLMHGGQVTVADSPQGGARFTTRWPRHS